MRSRVLKILGTGATLTASLFAQSSQRQATIVGGGRGDVGKCTIEVVVDDVAQVEVRGTMATLRTLTGQAAQWRRFECTSPMPPNPPGLRFSGVDGRGRQELVRDPRNGGAIVVQIEDKQGGSEGYTFDLHWDAQGRTGYPDQPRDQRGADNPPNQVREQPGEAREQPGYNAPDRDRPRAGDDRYRPDYRDSDYYRRYGHGFNIDDAVRVCQQAVFTQASRRFGTDDIHFHRSNAEDVPGRDDRITGTLDVHRGPREERFGFFCSMDFNNGRLRSAELDPRPLPDNPRWH